MTWLRYSEIEDRPDWLNDVDHVWVWNEGEEKPLLCKFDSDAEEFFDDYYQCICAATDLYEGMIGEIFVHKAEIPAKPEGVLP